MTHKTKAETIADYIRTATPEELRRRYPNFDPNQPGKNCKALLKAAFPSYVFRVRFETYAGGSSLRVSWNFGPAVSEVEQITDLFEAGSFDGSIDLYTYSRAAFSAVLGSAKFVFPEKRAGEDGDAPFFRDAVTAKILEKMKCPDWESEVRHNQLAQQIAYKIIGKTQFPSNKALNNWELVKIADSGCFEDIFGLAF